MQYITYLFGVSALCLSFITWGQATI